jgi:ABC-type uncharacterized transport system involved in gliding motility auxiliary subunit
VNHYEDHPIVKDMRSGYILLPIVRSLEVKNAGKSTVSKLFSTSDSSVGQVDLTSGRIKADDPKNKKGPFVLGAAGTYDTGRPNEGGRFVVVGTSEFLDNDSIATVLNRDLALNILNWLSSDEDLISIRAKEPEDRRLDPDARKMTLFAYSDLLGFPLLIIVSGIAVFMKRR